VPPTALSASGNHVAAVENQVHDIPSSEDMTRRHWLPGAARRTLVAATASRGAPGRSSRTPRTREVNDMGWSTREVAELAGTSLRAVRHYHEVGLLNQPVRRGNGYKQYGVEHLVRLLRIKRLTDLGFSLSRIAEMGEDDEHPEDAMRTLDVELAATIERLRRARMDLQVILRRSAPTDLPVELAPIVARVRLSEADRSFIVVLSRLLGPRGLRTMAETLHTAPDEPTGDEFDTLPVDVDEQVRQDLAERLVPFVRALHARNPGLRDLFADAPGTTHARDIAIAMRDLYNPAQLDVMRRVHAASPAMSWRR
jgi:DNA-binding transcriptional MerR regulator